MDPKKEAEDRLSYIYGVLQQIGNSERYSGFHYIVWGTAIALAMGLHLLFLVNSTLHFASYSWTVTVLIATIFSVVYFFREKRASKAKSYEKGHTQTVSLIFHSFLALLLLIVHQSEIDPIPVVFLVYGAWLLAIGGIIKYRPLILGGILNWTMALAAVYLSLSHQLLFGAIVCLLTYTLPGYLLYKRY